MTNKPFFRSIWAASIFAAVCVCVLACNSAKQAAKREKRLSDKAIAKLDKTADKYRDKSDIDTADTHWAYTRFPVKIGEGKKVYIPGKTITKRDTFTLYQKAKGDTVVKTVTVRTTTVRHDTIRVRDTVVDNRQISLIQAQLVQADMNTAAEREKAAKWQETAKAAQKGKYIAYSLLALIVLILIGGYILKRIPKAI